jgi:hypothetical protein
MALTKITGSSIADGTVVAADIADSSVSTNKIADSSVSTTKLASNLSISLTRVLEEANINSTAIGGNVNIDISNSTVYFFEANTTANLTFNLRANSSHTFDSAATIGGTTTVAIAVKHGADRHAANLYIDGGLITGTFSGSPNSLFYAGNTKPVYQAIANGELNLFTYSVFKKAANSYVVIAGNTIFGLG